MGAIVLLLGVVRCVGFSCCPVYFKVGSQVWLICIFCFSNWVSCEGPPYIKICDQTYVLKEKYLAVVGVYYVRTKTWLFIKFGKDLLVMIWVDIHRLYGPLCVVTCDVWTVLPLGLYPLCVKILWLLCIVLLRRVWFCFAALYSPQDGSVEFVIADGLF